MPTARSLLGKRAEELAVAEFTRRGCRVLETNYRCRWGEVDIIVRDDRTLVFVEVRSRRSNDPTSPSESVDKRKQAKLILTAEHYLTTHELGEDTDCRFDVAEVCFQRGKPVSVQIINGAFEVSE